jgi:hypothetical protein
MAAHAQCTGPDDATERSKKVSIRRKLIRQRDERIRLGLRVKKFARPTGTWSSAEPADAFTSGCTACGAPVPSIRQRSGTCSDRCYWQVRRVQLAERHMVNDSSGPQPCPGIRYSDRPAVQVPRNQTLTTERPRGSKRKVA